MGRVRTIVAGVVVVAAAGTLSMAAASAAPPTPTVGIHKHAVVKPDGSRVPVGPDACKNGMSVQFDNFHNNGHLGQPGMRGVIVYDGPCPS